ncbi:MAG: 6-carboxytetrahydropterin synthase [Thaumarchaeota archaeon]|nr:6-carboxytetrahydropterin synthase [Nitrososphaerota archaeon]
MKQDLLSRLAPRLKGLSTGGYERTYRGGSRSRKTSVHQLIASLLDSLGIGYKEDVRVTGAGQLRADFLVNGTWVFVERDLSAPEREALRKGGRDCLIVRRDALRSDEFDHGIRVLSLGETGDLQTIFLDDPSFNFDYAHILPKTRKCSVMHGHTSSVLVELVGKPVEGMVVDFGVAKEIIRDAVRSIDHKLFIREKYVTKMNSRSVSLKFRTVHGDFAIKAPRATTVLLSGEATVENLAREVLSRIAPRMPDNVTAVGVYVYEGLNKGSHLVAQVHQDEVEERRKKR